MHEHLDRLERSAAALSIVDLPPREKIIEELKRTLAANKMRDSVHIRLTLTRGVKLLPEWIRGSPERCDLDRSG